MVDASAETITTDSLRGREVMRAQGWVVLRDSSGKPEITPGWGKLAGFAWKLLTHRAFHG